MDSIARLHAVASTYNYDIVTFWFTVLKVHAVSESQAISDGVNTIDIITESLE